MYGKFYIFVNKITSPHPTPLEITFPTPLPFVLNL